MLSVVIPAYNESENIVETLDELSKAIGKTDFADAYEVIIVDDHSTDNTFHTVRAMDNPRYHSVRLSRRSGSHTALRAGLLYATGDVILCLSADGQDDPNVLQAMISKWQQGAQIVWALRLKLGREPLYVRLLRPVFYKMLEWLAEIRTRDIDLTRADFYLLDRKVVDALNSCSERHTSLFGLVEWVGFRQDCVEYSRRLRRHSHSKWVARARFRLAKDWIIAFSGLPLKLMTLVGFLIAGVGFTYAAVILVRKFLFSTTVEGWSSIMVALLVIGGLQVTMLGIIGEYLWRTLDESRQRRLFFVEDATLKFPRGTALLQESELVHSESR